MLDIKQKIKTVLDNAFKVEIALEDISFSLVENGVEGIFLISGKEYFYSIFNRKLIVKKNAH